MKKEELRNRVWTETPLAHYAMMNGTMKAGDFRKKAHFRSCSERCCMNCGRIGATPVKVSGPGETTGGTPVCTWNPFNPKTQFIVGKYTVCDYWRPAK